MSRKALSIIFIVSVCGSYILLTVLTRNSKPPGTDPSVDAYKNAISGLQLSAAQREQIASCCSRTIATQEPLEVELKRKLNVLRAELEKPQVDRASVERLLAEVSDLQGQILRSRVNAIIEVRETLTPDQLQMLTALKEGQR